MEKRRNHNRQPHRMAYSGLVLPFLLFLASCSPVIQTREEWQKKIDAVRPKITWVGPPSATNIATLPEQQIDVTGETEPPTVTIKKDGGSINKSYTATPREWWKVWEPKYKTVPSVEEGEGTYTITTEAKHCETSPNFDTYCSIAEKTASFIFDKTPPNAVIRTVEQRGGKLIVTYETKDAGVGYISVALADATKEVSADGLVSFELKPADIKGKQLTATACDSLGNCGTQNSLVQYDPFSLISIDSATISPDGKIRIAGNLHNSGQNLEPETMMFSGNQEWRVPYLDSLTCDPPKINPDTWDFTVVCKPPSRDGHVSMRYTIKDVNGLEQNILVDVPMPDASSQTKIGLISLYSAVLLSFIATGGTLIGFDIKKHIEHTKQQEAFQKLRSALKNKSVADAYDPFAYLYKYTDKTTVNERNTSLETWRTELREQITRLIQNRDVQLLQSNPLFVRVLREIQEQNDQSWFWRGLMTGDRAVYTELRQQLYCIRLVILALEQRIAQNRDEIIKKSPYKKGDRATYMIRTLCDWGLYAGAYEIIDGMQHVETKKIRRAELTKSVREDILRKSWETDLTEQSFDKILQSCDFINHRVKSEISRARVKLLIYKHTLPSMRKKFADSPIALLMLDQVQLFVLSSALIGNYSMIDHQMALLTTIQQLISGSLQWSQVKFGEDSSQDVSVVFQILHRLGRYDLTEEIMDSHTALAEEYRAQCNQEIQAARSQIERALAGQNPAAVEAAGRMLSQVHLPDYMQDSLRKEIDQLREQLLNVSKLTKVVQPILEIYRRNGFDLAGDDMPFQLRDIYKAVANVDEASGIPLLLMDIAKHVPHPQSIAVLKALIALYEMPVSGILGISRFEASGDLLILTSRADDDQMKIARRMHPHGFSVSPWNRVSSDKLISADSPQGKAITYFYEQVSKLIGELQENMKKDPKYTSVIEYLITTDKNILEDPLNPDKVSICVGLLTELFKHLLNIDTLATGESILKKIDEKLRMDIGL